MTHLVQMIPSASPEHRIAAVIKDYGAWRVLREAVRALVSVRPKKPHLSQPADLNAHLRRDIGLAPEASSANRYWDLG